MAPTLDGAFDSAGDGDPYSNSHPTRCTGTVCAGPLSCTVAARAKPAGR